MTEILETIDGEYGMQVLIVKNSNGKDYNAVLRDTDAEQTVYVKIVNSLDRCREVAKKMLTG